MITALTEPPVKVVIHGRFHAGAATTGDPSAAVYRATARRVGFRALTGGAIAAQLVHAIFVPADTLPGERHVVGGWLIADAGGNVSAHRGQLANSGSPWALAATIVPDSDHAVRRPTPSANPERAAADREASIGCLRERHMEAAGAGNLYATIQTHPDPCFVALLREAARDRGAQLILHDWLAERGFPHAAELRSKRRGRGVLTENQLLDLLTKPFASTRRSFSGLTASA